MNNLIPVYKPAGWTPLKAVKEFKRQHPEYLEQKVSYAGRLDPMAEGVLLLLSGEENKRRKSYEKLKKTYISEIILGIATDTFDPLGIIQDTKPNFKISDKQIVDTVVSFKKQQLQDYPAYSSKTVKGKSLYWWARQKRLDEIEIPKREIEIYSIKVNKISNLKVSNVYKKAILKISNIEGNFRQEEILNSWKEFYELEKDSNVVGIEIEALCSSGTYIRRLAYDIGKKLRCPSFAYWIKRTSVGSFSEKDCVVLK